MRSEESPRRDVMRLSTPPTERHKGLARSSYGCRLAHLSRIPCSEREGDASATIRPPAAGMRISSDEGERTSLREHVLGTGTVEVNCCAHWAA